MFEDVFDFSRSVRPNLGLKFADKNESRTMVLLQNI
jgi:hypothetical protein